MSDTELLSDQSIPDSASSVAESGQAPHKTRRRSGGGLSGMLLSELQTLAGQLGIVGVGRMRKGELIAAIQDKQGGSRAAQTETAPPAAADEVSKPQATEDAGEQSSRGGQTSGGRERRRATRGAGSPRTGGNSDGQRGQSNGHMQETQSQADTSANGQAGSDTASASEVRIEQRDRNTDRNNDRRDRGNDRNSDRNSDRGNDRNSQSSSNSSQSDDGNDFGGRGGRQDRNNDRGRGRSRFRSRRGGRDNRDSRDGRDNRGEPRGSHDPEPTVADDDVLIPVAGIVDVLDSYAFIRTSGYLAGSNDVYVSLSQVRKYGLRRGDAVTGAIRQPREGERQNKYNPLVRLDTVNGMAPDQVRNRAEFHKLTPLYPQDRLRLETESHLLTTRVIDLVMPIGKGQRALIVSPPKAGKTMVLQSIANAITANNPECHLMVVLVDERPEEVTDMTRSVKGEVIASTFDRPPQDHTTVAELSIERAKRLVELGADVVVLLDSITRLGRAYNLAAPASGRILSGGVDSTALYPPKRFLGAARNIENGGSLTIIATALVETGSTMDTVIFEEFKGTGNAELKLDRKIADKRVFPAVDVDASGTRKEEILLSNEELGVVYKLRKVLHALDSQQALDLLLDQLKKSRSNAEFLMQIQKTTPGE